MIELRNIKKNYISDKIKTIALRSINLSIGDHEFVSITGKSGCGKSTLLNILGGLDSATKGQYFFDDKQVSSLNGKELAAFRNKTIGYIFQAFNLIRELSILDNVALPLGYAGVSAKEMMRRSRAILAQVGLDGAFDMRPTQLSGGQQQRVAIARALVNRPRVLLADEPTGNLDEQNSHQILQLLRMINENGTAILLVTHDMQISQMATRRVEMKDGNIVGII